MRTTRGLIVVMIACIAVTACAPVVHSGAFPLGRTYPARVADCDVELFRTAAPAVPFDPIARITVRVQATGVAAADFDTALPELKRQACAHGADALHEFREARGGHVEMRAFSLDAVAIKFKR
jgi:hypothetical protein